MKPKLTKRHYEILEFCEEPKLVTEIAERFGIKTDSIYPYFRMLVGQGYLKTQSGLVNHRGNAVKLFYAARPGEEVDATTEIKKRIEVNPSDIYNMDFIRAAHNPFNLRLNHG